MPLPTYVSDAALLQDVADSLTSTGNAAELPPKWQRIAADANQSAVADITSILVNKGYTQAQIDAADDRASWNRKLGLWYALTVGNPLGNYPDKMLDKLDPREFLATAGAIRIGGVPTRPTVAATAVGGVGFGASTTTRARLEDEARCKGWFS